MSFSRNLMVSLVLLMLCVPVSRAQRPVTVLVDSQAGESVAACPDDPTSITYVTLQAAVGCAAPGTIIVVQAGTYAETLTIDKDLTIQGAGPNNTLIDGSGTNRPVTVADGVNLTLIDLTLTGGQAEQGGGVFANTATLTFQRVIFTGNHATLGGALYLGSGTLSLLDSTLSGNTATGPSGAGIYSRDASLLLKGSILTGNMLSGDCQSLRGAGLFLEAGSAEIVDSTFNGNGSSTLDCPVEGSGIYAASGQVTLTTSVITDAVITPETLAAAIVVEATPMIDTTQTVVQPPVQTTQNQVMSSTVDLGDSSVAVRWMDQIMTAVQAEKFSPPTASRVYACAGVTLYEALVPGLSGSRSLVGQIQGLVSLPQPEPGLDYDYVLVANTALAVLTEGLFVEASDATRQSFIALRQQIEAERGETVPMNIFTRSLDLGQTLGTAMLDWAHSDNYDVIHDLSYTLPANQPQFWVPLEGQTALEPYWGMLRPSVLPLVSICDMEPSIPFDIDADSAFFQQENEVYTTGVNLTSEQREIALFWADGTSETATPPGHWISIISQVVRQQKLSIGAAARAYALTGIAMGDAFISTWALKYRLQMIRPVTYINRYIDANWKPLIKTPPFPDYPSGHSVSSAAAATVLTGLFGDVSFIDDTHAAQNLPARSFTSFTQAAQEAALSRMYGGIHYRDAIESGLKQGNCIGDVVMKTLKTES